VPEETHMSKHIEDQTVVDFRRDGAAVLRGVFADWVETLRDGVARNLREPAPNARVYTDEESGGRFLVDYCNWHRIPEYKKFVFESPAAALGAELMESREVRLFHEHVLVKEAQTGIPTPWHHDMPYYCLDSQNTVSLWIPLDPVPRERTLEFVAGSHRWDKLYRPQRFDGSPLNENDGLEDIPDIDGNRDEHDILGWELEPGDAVAFDYRTIHGAPANNSPTTQRRAFSLRLVGEGTTFRRREGIVSSPPFPDVTLRNGDPLAGEEFPLLLGET